MNLDGDSEIMFENLDEQVYIRNLEKILVEEELSEQTKNTLQDSIGKFKQSIEDLRRRNSELKENEQKFKAFAQMGHWEWNLLTRKMELSEEAQKIYQLDHNIIDLSDVMDIIHPEDKIKVQEAIDRTIEYHETIPMECRIITPKGVEKWLRADEYAIIGESGDVEKVFGYIMDITERKTAEIQLRENEEKYRLLIENLGEGIGIVDVEENFIFCNQVAEEIFGVPQGKLVNRNLEEFVNQETLQFIKDQTELRKIGKKSNYEIIIIRPSGEERQIIVTATPQFNKKGDFIGSFGVIVDVTEHKQIENALFESEERLRSFMDSATDAFLLLDSEFKVIEVNKTALNTIGLERQDVINKYYGNFIPDFEESEAFFNYRKVLKTGNPIIMDDYIPHSKFGEVYYNVKIFRVGEGLGIIATNITEKKMVENELRRSQEKYRRLIDNLSDTVAELDSEANFVYVSPQSFEIFGFYPEEVIGENALEYIHPSDREIAEEVIAKILNNRKLVDFEYRIKHKKGYYVPISTSIRVVEEDEELKIFSILRDFTEHKRMEEELFEKRKLAALGQMAAGLAHEINTPLANINLTTEYLLSLLDKGKPKFKHHLLVIDELNDIKQQANFCVQIVKDLLLFSRKIDIVATSFSAKSFFSEIISFPTIGTSIKEKNIDVVLDIHSEMIIFGDKVLLSQCFQNIINNSIDAFSSLQVNPNIQISLKEHKKFIEAYIKDNGEGIREEDLTKIFEPFFTTKKVGQGTGLGLSIARGIIEKHNGKIIVNSTLGEGTEVKVILPK